MPQALGMIAWYLQRVTGIALVGYLVLHLVLIGISLIGGATAFDGTLTMLMTSKLIQVLDMGLFAAVLVHGMNGLRLILFDFGIGIRRQKALFAWGMAIACMLFILAVIKMLNVAGDT
jgi:succinate dehydrogenase / fumarate reductase cytochrome b subunit